MNTTHESATADDYDIADLLQHTGGRQLPSEQTHIEVEAAVRADWHAMVRQRKQHRRRVVGWSLAASIAVMGCASLLAVKITQTVAITVATIAHIEGRLVASSSEGPTPSVAVGQTVLSGESLRTDGHSRAALRWPSGLSVRLDHDTVIRIVSNTSIVLVSGSVYVDAAPDRAEPLSIQSPFGTVRHLGTQYIVSARPHALDVSVREGRVAIDSKDAALVGVAGERLVVSAAGAVERTQLGNADPAWQWITDAAPAFQIDNQTLAAFLNWVARETGHRLVFDSQQARSESARVILRGSIEGLDPDTALSVVLSTTRLHRYETKDDSIGIALNRD